MGRKPTRWANLPKGMRARERGKKVHYYLDTGGKPRKELPLGSDYVVAVQKWAELTQEQRMKTANHTFSDVADDYRMRVLPSKAARTQRDNEKELVWLLKFFGNPPAPLDEIEPVHVRQYMDWRGQEARKLAQAKNAERRAQKLPPLPIEANIGHVRANREKALFSHIFNFARSNGYTKTPNPCAGVNGFKESGRDVLVTESLLTRLIAVADKPLQFALRLAHLTGQRPADVRRMSEEHIAGGMLHVRQGKTNTKLRIEITGALHELLKEILDYKAQFPNRVAALLVNENGQPLTNGIIRTRFDLARAKAGIDKKDFQFRDLRASAATQVDEALGTRDAQALLGHSTETMTAKYIRHKVGKKVTPVK